MSFSVKTSTPEARTAAFSRSSRLRTPISTVCAASTLGEKPPMPASAAGAAPRSAASGMPWTLPDSVVSGVFMSPCASIQISPSGRPSRRANADEAATEPAPRLWSPPSTTGTPPSISTCSERSWSAWQTRAISAR
jgi:hypothetical protein